MGRKQKHSVRFFLFFWGGGGGGGAIRNIIPDLNFNSMNILTIQII